MSERRVLVWMCVLIAVNQLGFGAVIPVLPLYAQSFDVSQAAIGATVGVYGLARMVCGIPTGRLADALGRRAALATGGVLSALGNLWCALAGSYTELVAARFVAGAGAGIVLTAGIIVLADISTPARRGRTMAIYQGVFLFAVGIGPLPGGYLAETYGLEMPFFVYGIASLLAALVGWFGVAETRDLRMFADADAPVERFLMQLRRLARIRGLQLVSAVSLVNAIARTGALFSIVPIIARDVLGLSATRIGAGLAMGSVMGLLITYPSGALVDRYGRKTVIVPATLLCGVSMLLFTVPYGYVGYLTACAVWGAASASSGAAPSAYAADSAPPGLNAAAMGMYRTISDVGYVAGPILLGLLADTANPQKAVWVSAAMLVAVGLAFGRYAPETHRGGGA